jgi:methylmalonyl-CoA mutase cobalamin-binding subunit
MTELLTTELRHLYALLPEPSGPRVLLATLPNELHRIALDLFALDIGSVGFDVTILGAETPPSEIAKAAVALEVDAVGLFATAALDLDKTRHALKALILELPRRVRVWLGGSAAEGIEMQDLQHFASYRELDREIGKLRSSHRPIAGRLSANEEPREARATRPGRVHAPTK